MEKKSKFIDCFKKDQIVIDGLEYSRSDIQLISAIYDGTKVQNQYSNNTIIQLNGMHTIMGDIKASSMQMECRGGKIITMIIPVGNQEPYTKALTGYQVDIYTPIPGIELTDALISADKKINFGAGFMSFIWI